ncbi:HupE/UreJ family protein [Marixanthomonas ophiurae]|uniref:HupE/UreJ family protein n=1 Tax=Marixanthomonas ophiurae TaxID=387659 RepID=A0A3E1Q9W4_9FLAO|nr:HupE/UreJ family protein [Marixanthomonas ophiurae]RFN58923.1 HupE/UreJ family protein [Marixanthomonas ophiurae]
MTDFWLFFKLGLEHVLDWQAYDHVLFIIVLCAAYTFNAWRKLLVLVTLFTVGHTISLLLANYGVVSVSSSWIECLIPITILVTALFNLFTAGKEKRAEKLGVLYVATVFFGLIHGFGFAGYFKMISGDNDVLHLLEFALGIEAAQLIVVILVLILAFLMQTIFRFNKRDWVLVISSIVIGLVIPMLIDNCFFLFS